MPIFEKIEKISDENDKIIEESMGDPRFERDENLSEEKNANKEGEWIAPSYYEQQNKSGNPLEKVTEDEIEKLLDGLKKQEKGPESDSKDVIKIVRKG
jgi:hypothetical protein